MVRVTAVVEIMPLILSILKAMVVCLVTDMVLAIVITVMVVQAVNPAVTSRNNVDGEGRGDAGIVVVVVSDSHVVGEVDGRGLRVIMIMVMSHRITSKNYKDYVPAQLTENLN